MTPATTANRGSAASWCRLLVCAVLAGLFVRPVHADEFRTPAITFMKADWPAAASQLKAEIESQPLVADQFSFTAGPRSRQVSPRRIAAIAQLNAVTAPIFPGIGLSPVPVLLPFDTALYLADRRSSAVNLLINRYQAGFNPAAMFDAGPSGYSAVFTLDRGAGDSLRSRVYLEPVEVQITASLLIYDIKDPLAGKGEPVKALTAQFPNIRRVIREGFVRYAFTRFGIPYVVSI